MSLNPLNKILQKNMNKPTFFIIGAAKAGTSSLWAMLKQHDQVFMPADKLNKEPAYFSNKGQQCLKEYLALFTGTTTKHKCIGEASTAYLTDINAARAIHSFNPESKIIISIRNPIDRAYSLYNWMVQEGYEWVSIFENALILEEKRKFKRIPNFFEPEYYWNYMYFSSGLYYEQIKRYINLFKKKVLIIEFEKMIKEPEDNFRVICNFLEIKQQRIQIKKENVSKQVCCPHILFFLIKRFSIFSKRFKKISEKNHRDRLLQYIVSNKNPKKMDSNTRYFLRRKYENDINKLGKLIDLDLSSWLEN